MKRGKTLDAEDLQNEFATLIDVAEAFSSSSAPMDCRDSPPPIALSGFKTWRVFPFCGMPEFPQSATHCPVY